MSGFLCFIQELAGYFVERTVKRTVARSLSADVRDDLIYKQILKG